MLYDIEDICWMRDWARGTKKKFFFCRTVKLSSPYVRCRVCIIALLAALHDPHTRHTKSWKTVHFSPSKLDENFNQNHFSLDLSRKIFSHIAMWLDEFRKRKNSQKKSFFHSFNPKQFFHLISTSFMLRFFRFLGSRRRYKSKVFLMKGAVRNATQLTVQLGDEWGRVNFFYSKKQRKIEKEIH